MIRHIVLLDLPENHDRSELAAVMAGIGALQKQIAGYTHFEHGPNRDFEQMSRGCKYAFICQFDKEATAQTYLDNADHQALGIRLVSLCRGGVRGISVIDMDVSA